MNLPEIHLYRPRAHHDDSNWEIHENQVTSIQLKREPEFLPGYHVHRSSLSLGDADKIIQDAGMADRFTVVRIQGCRSPKDKEQPPGSFIILKKKNTVPSRLPEAYVPERKPVEQKPPEEALTPGIMGRRLFEAFEGYDHYGHQSSVQLSDLIRHQFLSPTVDGYPVYTLTSYGLDDAAYHWCKKYSFDHDPVTTARYTPDSPHLEPLSLHHVSEIITVTNVHHFFIHPLHEEHDMLFARREGAVAPFFYIKGKEPIEPYPAASFIFDSLLNDPLWKGGATMIQLWKLLPEEDTYQLQVTLQTHNIDLMHFLDSLKTPPSGFSLPYPNTST